MSSFVPCVVVVGRPNVGKSSIFNRLLGRKRALVHDFPGVTRDRIEESAEWMVQGRKQAVSLIDTGGLEGDIFEKEIRDQVSIALEKANIVLLVLDGREGLTPRDRDVILGLQRSGLMGRVPVVGIINKLDTEKHDDEVNAFFEAGLDHWVGVSAEHNRGFDEVRDMVFDLLKLGDQPEETVPEPIESVEGEEGVVAEPDVPPRVPRIAILGRPNVGKSTLVNAILGENRMITSSIAGTTIDSIDTEVEWGGRKFIIVDTAGIRKKSRTEQGVEVLSVVQARKALERADVVLLVLDGETGPVDQDEKISGLIEDSGRAVVLVVNKWDTQRKNDDFPREEAAERIRKQFRFLGYAPIVFTSALRGTGFHDLPDLISDIMEQRMVKVTTHEFSEWVRKESEIHNPMNAKFYLSHQTTRNPPTFVCHVSDPEKVHFSLKRHFVNAIRERWGYMGSPVRMTFVKSRNAQRK